LGGDQIPELEDCVVVVVVVEDDVSSVVVDVVEVVDDVFLSPISSLSPSSPSSSSSSSVVDGTEDVTTSGRGELSDSGEVTTIPCSVGTVVDVVVDVVVDEGETIVVVPLTVETGVEAKNVGG